MPKTYAHILRQSSFFEGLTPEACGRLAKRASSRKLRKRDFLFIEQSRGSTVYILVEGRIQLYKATADGGEVVIRTVRPGEIFGEVILFEADRYPVTAAALAPSVVLAIDRADILDLLRESAFRASFIAMLMRKQRYLAERVRYLSSYDVEERFFLFLREQFGEQTAITPGISKKDLAAAIGATPETFSRLLQRLKAEGALTWQGRTLKVPAEAWVRHPAPSV